MVTMQDFFQSADPVARIELAVVKGSSPREAGTVMYVSPEACFGTIGGGQLEYMAIEEARAMLTRGQESAHMAVPLGPEIGQCCGGYVEIALNRMTDADVADAIRGHGASLDTNPMVYVFGAGHVGRALADMLALLPVRTVLIDSRAEELELCTAPVEKRWTPLPEADVRSAPPGSAFIILTHDHALDFLIAADALARPDARYVGMIGSKTKRASFLSWCRKNIEPSINTDALVCPMGTQGSKDKRPEVIAAFVAAEVIGVLTDEKVPGERSPAQPETVGGKP